ncbi:MAG: hypothetical protein HY695_29445 [Deltaproteobacteria bacterium]|nr:hypothetical protein [Deltaproteobacteria bacterium]
MIDSAEIAQSANQSGDSKRNGYGIVSAWNHKNPLLKVQKADGRKEGKGAGQKEVNFFSPDDSQKRKCDAMQQKIDSQKKIDKISKGHT